MTVVGNRPSWPSTCSTGLSEVAKTSTKEPVATAASTVTPGVTPGVTLTVAPGFADAVGAVGSAASTAASTVSVQRLARLRGALPSSIAFSRSSFAAPSPWSALARTQSTEFMVGAVGAGWQPPLRGHPTPQRRGSAAVYPG